MLPTTAKPTIDYDTLAGQYARNRQLHPAVFQELLATGDIRADRHILEVGCGSGNYIAALEEAVGCPAWGIDPSAGMLAQASQRSERINLQLGQAEALPMPDACFDLAFSVDAIHHVDDQAAYFQETYRLLKTGGRLCTVTDSAWIIRHRQPLATYFPETIEPELKRYPRIAVLRQWMQQAGYQKITELVVAFSYNLTDISSYRDRVFSALHLISQAAFQRGLDSMEADLAAGPIPCIARYLLLWGTK